jgi:hypothetical protein
VVANTLSNLNFTLGFVKSNVVMMGICFFDWRGAGCFFKHKKAACTSELNVQAAFQSLKPP